MAETDNKRLAKNTLYMYVRMGIGMLIGLYTSRVVLNALGITDFGIYNIVGSVVCMFWFISAPLEGATQRFLTFELGRNDIERLNKVFNISLQSFTILAVIFYLSLEIAGFWLLNNKLQIPAERIPAAKTVFHLATFTTALSLLLIPFNALIIAYERMSFYAYIGILDAVLKLLNALSLLWLTGDKLIIYAINAFVASLVYAAPLIIFCRRHFKEIKFKLIRDKALTCEMIRFSGWSLFGATASMSAKQGVNIVVNLFFGVAINAAMGIANQILNAVQKFAWSFQTAFRPQIVKLYAAGQISDLHKLIFRTSRFSYLLLFAIACPLMFNMDYVLQLWLVNPPAHASTFASLMLISALFDSLSAPLLMTVQATGTIRTYQIVMSAIILMNIVCSYIFLSQGYPAYIVLVINNAISMLLLAARLLFIKRMIRLSLRQYLTNVVIPIALVTIIATLLTKLIFVNVDSFGKLALFVTLFAAGYIPITYLIGLHRHERTTINKLILAKLRC